MTTETKRLPVACFGRIVTTRAVHDEVPAGLVRYLVSRHLANDWGDLDEHDCAINAEACNQGEGRVMSSYSRDEARDTIYIISALSSDPKTQANPDYCNTTVMFAEEY